MKNQMLFHLNFFLYLQNHTFKTQPHEGISSNCVDV